MDEIQQRFNSEWKVKFPHDKTPMLHRLNEDDRPSDNTCSKPREILQKLYNVTRERSEELKKQLEHCAFIETFVQDILADSEWGESHISNVLENCVKSTIQLNTGILLESDIDAPCANNSDGNSPGAQENHVLPEQKLTKPPIENPLTTEICDNTKFDKHDSRGDTQVNNVHMLEGGFNHRKWNSTQEKGRNVNSDPLPRKFSEPSKGQHKPTVPPRKDKASFKHFEHVEFAPIQSAGEPKFKSTITVCDQSANIGKSEIEETNLDDIIESENICNQQTGKEATNLDSCTGNNNTEINTDYRDIDTDEEIMKKIRKKSNKDIQNNVVATSFRKISQENDSSYKDSRDINKENSDHLAIVKSLCDKPPGIPERKPSVNMEEMDNNRKKRQSRNDYENISLDFILTRSQKIIDSAESEESEEDEIYDNVVNYKKTKDENNSNTGDKTSNSLDTLSISSSGGDNSVSSSCHSPSALNDHVPSIRDSVFINPNKDIKPQDDLDGGNSDQDFHHVTEIRVEKSMDDDDSTEDNISCDSLDDKKLEDIERMRTDIQKNELMRQERKKKLHMRQIVVKGILESEKTYLQILSEITFIKRNLQTKSLQEHRMCPLEDLSTIFYKVEEIRQYHQQFVNSLEEKVEIWTDDQKIGEIFKELTLYIPVYKEYVDNLNKARELIQRCCNDNSEFKRIVSTMEINMTNGFTEKTSLEEALFKPVQRLQRNTLVLHDLLMHTPTDHPDYQTLNKALSLADHNIKSFGGEEQTKLPKEEGHLVKSGFVVEVVGNSRKLRFLFLYSDIIVCTKHKVSGRHKVKSFDCKWFIPICNINVDAASTDSQTYSCKEDIEALKKKIVNLKAELRREVRKNNESFRDRSWSFAGKVSARSIEKLKKKIEEQEAQLVLSSPYLPLHIKTRDEDSKDYIILISTDFEREEWRDAILSQQRHPHGIGLTRELSYHGIQIMINKSTQLPQVNNIGSVLSKNDEEMLSGLLNVTIHNLNGLDQPCDVFVVLELDSFGHFFKKAQTHKCLKTTDPTWDEDFELELDGSQTLRILCYKVASPSNLLIGRSALELSKEWLSSSFKEQKISMNEISLTISVRHTTAAKTLKRTPSKLQGGIFGFKIKTVCMREGKTIPSFVSSCIRLVEQRGMDEVGIYRISGVTSEIQRIKKAFDKNLRAGMNILDEADIHAVTGVLKLYFRELPEPLFTEASYTQFVDSLALADEDSKEKCMLQLLHSLPDVNYYCIVSVIEHLVKVSKHESENKMSLNNLATIFGPTLLHPAVKEDSKVSPAVLMMQGAQDVFTQAAVLYYFLELVHSGKSIRKSSKLI